MDDETTGDDGAGAHPGDPTGRLTAVFTAPEGSAPMERRESVRAVEGGLRGDRYCNGSGHYSPFDVCEVTLVSRAALRVVREEYGIDLREGEHRRNLVVAGVDPGELLDATFRVGGAVLRGTRPRPPCAHLEAVAGEDGLARALTDGRGGICAAVVEAGRIREGDPVAVETPDPATAGERIAERLRREAAAEGEDEAQGGRSHGN